MSVLTKIEIQSWLYAKHNGSREWLATKLGVSKGTVDQWFSRGFSDSALAGIAMIMELDASSPSVGDGSDETSLIQFTSGEFERIEAARAAVGSPARPVFYRDAIIAYVDGIEEGGNLNSEK